MELIALLKTCWKRKWVILAFTIAVPVFTLILCLNMTKVYECVARVKIVQFEDTHALLQKQIPEKWGQLDHVGGVPTVSQAEVVRSRMVVEPVIKKLNLRRRVTIIEKMLKAIGLIEKYKDQYIRLDKLVEPGFFTAFMQRRQLYIDTIEDSDIIEIYAYSDIVEEARDMTNEVAASYLKQSGALKQQKAREALDIIQSNLGTAEGELERTQNELKKFQEHNYVVDLDKRIMDVQNNLTELENQRLSTINDLMVRESRLKELSEGALDSGELQATLKSIEGYPHIQEMEGQLMALESSLASMLTAKTAKHPDALELQAQIDGLKKQILGEIRRLFENEIVELTKTNELLKANIRDVRGEVERLAGVNRQLQDLQRQVGIAETTYLNLAAARDGALTAAATSYSNATVITWAELPDPSKPYYPQAALYTILAIFVGLLFGFGMAFVVEFMDISVKDAEDIKRASNKIVLGAIPKMLSLRSRRIRKLGAADKFAGAILEIKHNVLEHLGDKKIIAVTSALRKEGKTKLICHLAVVLAEDGHAVALVDLNLRNPAVHTVFGVSNSGGVSDVLAGGVEDVASIAQTYSETPQLSIFPAGSRSEGSIHKLASPTLKDFIASVEKNHDYVLLDTAASESLAGGPVVAALAQCTLLVVSAEGPSPQKLEETIHALENAGAVLLGVVANRV